MPATMKASASPGPAWLAAAVPVRTKMPVPMMAPMPSATRAVAERQRLSLTPVASSACSSSMDFVASSWLGMGPPAQIVVGADYGGPSLLAQLGRQVRGEQLQQRLIHLGGACQDVAPLLEFASGECGDAPASFLDEQSPRRGIPGREADFPESIRAPGG